MSPDRLKLGEFEIFGLREGFFSLDGGAMFGVVPKILWEKKFPADKANRIRLGLNSLVVKTPEAVVLVETGIGTKLDEKLSGIYDVNLEPGLVASLARLGLLPKDVDVVINTHLHFDHCGGNTKRTGTGEVRPTFPRARYVIQKGEWEAACFPNDREKSSYLKDNFLPLEQFRQLDLVDGDHRVVEGVEVVVTPGHTASHQGVRVRSAGRTLLYCGDLVPTSAHIGLPYIMSYDLFPLQTLETKKKIYEQAIAEDWIFAFVHDPVHFFGKIRGKNGKFEFAPLEFDPVGPASI